jgi:hypothetical protein
VVDVSKTITQSLAIVPNGSKEGTDDESAEEDCSAHPEAPTFVVLESEGADCNGEDEKAISKEENCP